MSKIQAKGLAVLENNGERNLVLALHHYRREALYCDVKFLHPKFEGFINGFPEEKLTPFSFQEPGATSDNLEEVFAALAFESYELREENKALKQKVKSLKTITDHDSVDAILA